MIALTGNDWSVLAGVEPEHPPTVSVIVAHYDQQGELDRTLAALARQTHPTPLTQVIVVDDGSPVAPRVPAGVLLLLQADRGFRLAAARNLGASRATGEVLVFLDADTAPEPGYLAALTRLPALAPDVLAVGRRRHADFAGEPVDAPVELVGPRHELPSPAWLTEAYEQSSDLLHSDDRSYRYVIGAVMACSRTLYDATGGFDETFTTYGGEDWEWAHRAWSAGAAFAHVPAATAWHDGPEWAFRPPAPATAQSAEGTEFVAMAAGDDRLVRKNAETLALALRIPVAGSRPPALRFDAPLPFSDSATGPAASGGTTTTTATITPAATAT
ncbi:glycosyltransferase, partial [Subtercola sp. Z020]|uniref:glycosyltransferase family 2 protein n=1 Tax=Subtercola sp. Z020 TaxID=2080582 RepID=UPI000CE75EEA